METVKKGSLTVEIALLSPMILTVLFLTVSLCIFVHHRVWLGQAAYEAALTGTMEPGEEAVRKTLVNTKAEELAESLYYPLENTEWKVTGEEEITVEYCGKFQVFFPGMNWELKEKGQTKTVDPPAFIRKIHALKEK